MEETSIIKAYAEGGLIGLAFLSLIIITVLFIRYMQKREKEHTEYIEKRDVALAKFINQHNDAAAEIMQECSTNIALNTEVLKNVLTKIN